MRICANHRDAGTARHCRHPNSSAANDADEREFQRLWMAAARAFADLGRVARLHSLAVGIIKKGYPSRHPAQLATCSNDFNSRSFAFIRG